MKEDEETPVRQRTRSFGEVFAEQRARVGLGRAITWNLYYQANRPLRRLTLALDKRRDLKICGVSLVEGTFSRFRESQGATNSVSTPYGALAEILGPEHFDADDALVDIGCGHGRVLAYLLDSGFPGHIAGIELDPDVARFTQQWAQRYPQVEVIAGDALEADLSRYNVLYLWRPMLGEVFRQLIRKIEAEAKRDVRMFYLTDFDTATFLTGRPGWEETSRKKVYRHHGLPVFGSPQDCSVWRFTPGSRN